MDKECSSTETAASNLTWVLTRPALRLALSRCFLSLKVPPKSRYTHKKKGAQ